MNVIQWFVRLIKKDMGDYEERAEEKQKIYKVVTEGLKNRNLSRKKGEKR